MKVTHISVSSKGGAGIAAYRLHRSLKENSMIESSFVQQNKEGKQEDEEICCVHPSNYLLYRIQKKYKITTEDKNHQKIPKHGHHLYEIATFPTSSYRIEDEKIVKNSDIIHLHWVGDFLNYPSFFDKIKQPIVWTLHDMNPFQGVFHYLNDQQAAFSKYGSIDRDIYNYKKKILQNVNNIKVVCLSEWMKEKSEKSELLGRYPHYLIPNGLNFSQYSDLDKYKLKNELGVNNSKKTILFISSHKQVLRKGFDILIDAIKLINRSDFNLISIGEGELHLDKNINHLHFGSIHNTSELNKLYSAADITIIPSREDNLPNVMLESFVNATPIIGFSNSGMAEHIKTGENGILVYEINANALAKAINDFLDNKYSFDNQRIRKYAEEVFSDKLQTERYVNLYRQILNR